MNAVVRLCHTIVVAPSGPLPKAELQRMAREAIAEHDAVRFRVAVLEKELRAAKRAILYPMTDLA